MNQPDLGRKIVELRKAKGFTQEELVTKCNLNVRTLQRIEAGEVTPRSYTIKTIFSVLDYDVYDITNSGSAFGNARRTLSQWLGQFYRYTIDLFNLKTNTMKKISILSVLAFAVSFGMVTIFSESNAQSPARVKKAIEESNSNFVRWFNNGQLDSLMSIYRDDACLIGKGCGKTVLTHYYGAEMRQGYKFKELNVNSVSVNNDLAVEKGRFVIALNSEAEIQGEYITEWKLTNKKWKIVSDLATVTNVTNQWDAKN